MYRVRRRRRVLLCAVLALVLAQTAFVAARHLFDSKARIPSLQHRTYVSKTHQTEGSAVRWPQRGQAALVLGNGGPAASPDEEPVAIASLANVMTAYAGETGQTPRPGAAWRSSPTWRSAAAGSYPLPVGPRCRTDVH
ncbi:MAG: hypothetical protein ACLP4R_28920 [Solirubrobacteraceae bacterium]